MPRSLSGHWDQKRISRAQLINQLVSGPAGTFADRLNVRTFRLGVSFLETIFLLKLAIMRLATTGSTYLFYISGHPYTLLLQIRSSPQ